MKNHSAFGTDMPNGGRAPLPNRIDEARRITEKMGPYFLASSMSDELTGTKPNPSALALDWLSGIQLTLTFNGLPLNRISHM